MKDCGRVHGEACPRRACGVLVMISLQAKITRLSFYHPSLV
jgi:hypothetical protein